MTTRIRVKECWRFLAQPGKAFARAKDASFRQAFVYFLVLLVLHSLLGGILYAFVLPELGLLGFGAVFLLAFLGTLASMLWLHAWAYLLGFRGFRKTAALVCFGGTPGLLIGWIGTIPGLAWVRLLTLVWSFVLYGKGLRAQGCSKPWLAVAAAFISGLVIFILLAALLIFQVVPAIFLLAAQGG